jgi:hypothetical protein
VPVTGHGDPQAEAGQVGGVQRPVGVLTDVPVDGERVAEPSQVGGIVDAPHDLADGRSLFEAGRQGGVVERTEADLLTLLGGERGALLGHLPRVQAEVGEEPGAQLHVLHGVGHRGDPVDAHVPNLQVRTGLPRLSRRRATMRRRRLAQPITAG